MSRRTPGELRGELGSGLLCFPVTHATEQFELDAPAYGEHLRWLAEYRPAGVFVAGGTGEFFCLTLDEVDQALHIAVETAGALPVVAPVGYGTAMAVAMARDAENAGADGIFLLPPYLTDIDQEGLLAHVQAVCEATSLGVIVYHRANARFTAEIVGRLVEACPNFIGFKDGVGDVDLMASLYATHGERLLYVGGLPTAETYALPYSELGASTYSSAIFNFAPGWASDFYRSVQARDHADVYRRLNQFVLPYVAIRKRRAGYAVSIVKAALDVVGRGAGPVRPPLVGLTETERDELAVLVKDVI